MEYSNQNQKIADKMGFKSLLEINQIIGDLILNLEKDKIEKILIWAQLINISTEMAARAISVVSLSSSLSIDEVEEKFVKIAREKIVRITNNLQKVKNNERRKSNN